MTLLEWCTGNTSTATYEQTPREFSVWFEDHVVTGIHPIKHLSIKENQHLLDSFG